MLARKRLVTSLTAALAHIDAGGLADKALPGSPTAEAMRLVKNGVAVATFACYELFVRERIAELLEEVCSDGLCPDFKKLPMGLQVAATKGVVDAVRYRVTIRGDELDPADIVELTQAQAAMVAQSADHPYKISPLAFGHNSANVSGGTLSEFFKACDAPALLDGVPVLLAQIGFDYIAAGLASDQGQFRLSALAGWRHTAAHDATLSMDTALLRTRISSYLSLAFAFDALASFAVRGLIGRFDPASRPQQVVTSDVATFPLTPDLNGDAFTLTDHLKAGEYYSVEHCKTDVGNLALPTIGAVVVLDGQGQLADWFFV